jgi:hypothetical protein
MRLSTSRAGGLHRLAGRVAWVPRGLEVSIRYRRRACSGDGEDYVGAAAKGGAGPSFAPAERRSSATGKGSHLRDLRRVNSHIAAIAYDILGLTGDGAQEGPEEGQNDIAGAREEEVVRQTIDGEIG